MGMAVTASGWLTGRRALVIGDSPAVVAALERAGAQPGLTDDHDICVLVIPPAAVRPAHELNHADWRSTLDTGLDAPFRQARAFAQSCRDRGIGSAMLIIGPPEQTLGADHAAAAGGLGNLVKSLAVEWARDGFRVNAILTDRTDDALGNFATYLLSDYSAYVTGMVTGLSPEDGICR